MFEFLKKKNMKEIASPANGQVIPVAEVPDETFSSGMLGDGFAVVPEDGNVYAPVDGTVSMIVDTKHALSIAAEWGGEILIHIGLETVGLKGEPFEVCVTQGQHVKKGDLLVKTDLNRLKTEGLNTMVITLVCGSAEYAKVELDRTGAVRAAQAVMTVELA